MTQRLHVRRVDPDDVDRILELHEAALRSVDAYAEGVVDDGLADPIEHYVETGGEFLVGTVDDEVVAMGALSPVEDDAMFVDAALETDADGRPLADAVEITRMRVDPDHQQLGYGSRLLEALEERAHEIGFKVAVLDTTARQTGAQRLYEGFGYERVETLEWREYDVLLYRKVLD